MELYGLMNVLCIYILYRC